MVLILASSKMKLLGCLPHQSLLVISFTQLDHLDETELDALNKLDTYTYAAYLLHHAPKLEYVYFWLKRGIERDEYPLAAWKVIDSGADGAERSLEEMAEEESIDVFEDTVFARSF